MASAASTSTEMRGAVTRPQDLTRPRPASHLHLEHSPRPAPHRTCISNTLPAPQRWQRPGSGADPRGQRASPPRQYLHRSQEARGVRTLTPGKGSKKTSPSAANSTYATISRGPYITCDRANAPLDEVGSPSLWPHRPLTPFCLRNTSHPAYPSTPFRHPQGGHGVNNAPHALQRLPPQASCILKVRPLHAAHPLTSRTAAAAAAGGLHT